MYGSSLRREGQPLKIRKECLLCGVFYEEGLSSIQKFCPACRKTENQAIYIAHIKKTRHIEAKVFDVYDLDSPRSWYGYERVCRNCGGPLPRKKDGSYNPYRRFCDRAECNAFDFFSKYNWSACRYKYLLQTQDAQKERIIKELKMRDIKRDYNTFVFCETCGKFCISYDFPHLASDLTCGIINVHHITPVHTLTEENLMLIFDTENLICLCEECHNKQDHQLSKISKVVNNRKITEWI